MIAATTWVKITPLWHKDIIGKVRCSKCKCGFVVRDNRPEFCSNCAGTGYVDGILGGTSAYAMETISRLMEAREIDDDTERTTPARPIDQEG